MSFPLAINTQTAQNLVIPRLVMTAVSAFLGLLDTPIVVADDTVLGGEVFNVMSTLVGDDVMNPTYGCNLPLRVFDPITPRLIQQCLSDVYVAAQAWLPQITVSLAQTLVYASASNRLVGVGVAYLYSGGSWLQNVDLAGVSGQLGQ